MRRAGLLTWLLGTGLALAQPQSTVSEETGYRIEPGLVVVEDPAHWRGWEAGDGTRIVEADGTVRPRFIRADIDAVANAGQFVNITGNASGASQ